MSTVNAKFASLNTFIDEWALETEQERFDKRVSMTEGQIKPFYEAIIGLMPDIMEYLKDKPVNPDSEEDANLMHLALSCVEVSRIFEVWGQKDVRSDYLDPARVRCVGYEGVKNGER
ncbi:MAG TPA: hypothetical protein EYG48_06420 [Methylococcales bacterium]|jgi:hypothetical protein|nr:hypothetical protein [Methylococcales bacterium]